jgi:hypothetical protein
MKYISISSAIMWVAIITSSVVNMSPAGADVTTLFWTTI